MNKATGLGYYVDPAPYFATHLPNSLLKIPTPFLSQCPCEVCEDSKLWIKTYLGPIVFADMIDAAKAEQGEIYGLQDAPAKKFVPKPLGYYHNKYNDAAKMVKSNHAYHSAMDQEDGVERTLVMLKPDAYERGLVGEILDILEQKDLVLVAAKQVTLDQEGVAKHYKHHLSKNFYAALEQFMTSGPSLALVYEGKQACAAIRQLIGNKHPSDSPPGSIRGKYAIEFPQNLIHGSDNYEEAGYEISLYFTDEEILGKKYKKNMLDLAKKAAEEAAITKQKLLDGGGKINQYLKYPEMFSEGQLLLHAPSGQFFNVKTVKGKGGLFTITIEQVTEAGAPLNKALFDLNYTEENFPSSIWKLLKKPVAES